MKILMINYSEVTSPGGVHKTIIEVAKNLSKMGHEVTVLQGNSKGFPNKENYEGFQIIRVKSKIADYLYGFSPEISFYLKNHFKELNPEIVHVHGYHTLFSPEMIYLIKKIDSKIPIVFTAHYDPLNRSTVAGKLFGGLYNYLIGKKLFKTVNTVISISDFEASNIKMIQHPNITVVPHGIDNVNIKDNKKDETLKLLYVGYLLDYKGVQHIIMAVERLVKVENLENVKLTIIGEGKFKKKLIKLSKELNLEDFIYWKPFLPHNQVLEEMEKHDIFLILSKTEGYGIVVAESLSRGTPVIVTNGTALEEFTIENGCFGVDYPPKPEEVTNLIMNIHENEVEIGPFSEKIRTWDKVAEDYELIYGKLVK